MNRRTALPPRAAGSAGIHRRAALAAAAVLALGAAGCVARTTGRAELVYEHPVVEVEAVPVQVEAYPRYYYRGSYAYLVDGRWYYRTPGRWVVFREEPAELRSARRTIVRDQRQRPTHVVPPTRGYRD
jgi:hypothetical protein